MAAPPLTPAVLFDNLYRFGRGTFNARPAIVIPVGRSLRGESIAETYLRAASSVSARFVTNAGYTGSGNSYTYTKVQDCAIDGDRPANQDSNPLDPVIAHGVEIDGRRIVIKDNLILNFNGSCVRLRQEQFCKDNFIGAAFTGVDIVGGSDTVVSGNIVAGCRDYGLKTSGLTGNAQSLLNHYFGHGQHAIHLEGTGSFRGIGDTYADSSFGVWCASPGSTFDACMMQQNATTGGIFGAENISLNDCRVEAQRVTNWSEDVIFGTTYGLWFNGNANYFKVDGGSVNLTNFFHGSSTPTGAASMGILVELADHGKIHTNIYDADGVNGSTGIYLGGDVKGLDLNVQTKGFHDATAKILIANNAGCRAIRGLIRGEGVGSTGGKAVANYFTLPFGWDGRIDVVDTLTGVVTTLTGPTAYP